MFSDIKWHIRSTLDGMRKERRLSALVFAWTVFCAYWSCHGQYESYLQLYHVRLCAADELIMFQGHWNFGIMLLPVFTFFVMKSSRESLNIQQLLRYRSRKKMFRKQIREGIIYAFIITTVMLAVETVFARAMTESFINWDQIDSLYYSMTGGVEEVSFPVVLGMIFIMYLVKLLQILIFMEALFWCPKYMPTLWILLILLAAISSWRFDGYYQFFSVQTASWDSPVKMGGAFLLGILVILAEYSVGVRFIRKIDLYGEMNTGE